MPYLAPIAEQLVDIIRLDLGRAGPRRPRPVDPVTPWWCAVRSQPQNVRFNPAEWSVAVVDAHS